jgi:hypothetical protein
LINTKKYGSTHEENIVLETAKCREIINEILDFGVNQRQIIKLIKLLSLELEDRGLMLKIISVVDNNEEQHIDKPVITI